MSTYVGSLFRTRHAIAGLRAGLLGICYDSRAADVDMLDEHASVLFEGGKFGESDVWPTVLTSCCLIGGLPFLGLAQLYARAFYAVDDAGTPARLAAWLVVLNAILNFVLVLTTNLGTAALALSSSLSSLANATILAARFHRHAPPSHDLRGAWLRSGIATAAMCVALPFLRLADAHDRLLWRSLGNVAFPIVAGVVVYVVAHALLRSPELAALRRRRKGQ